MAKNTVPSLIVRDDLLIGGGQDTLAGVLAAESTKRDHAVAYLAIRPHKKLTDTDWPLGDDRLIKSDVYLRRANKSIHRSWPTSKNETNELLRRDTYLTRWCETIYCVGRFTDDASLLKISGDLAWPCQIYVDRFLYDQEPMDLCKLYMFDLKSESWFNWRYRWHRTNDIPQPKGVYAALGADRLTKAARTAIESIWY